jgi:hypothetical protein
MIYFQGDNVLIPIKYIDSEHLIVDTEKIREDFENFISDLEDE